MFGWRQFQHVWYCPVQSLVQYMTYSSCYLSLAAGAMCYISCTIQGTPFLPSLFVICFLVTFAVYNMNRKTDEKEDEINHNDRYQFTKRYEGLLANSALASYVLALLLAAMYGIPAACVTAFPLVAGLLYSIPLLPRWLTRYRRLKEIQGVKNLIVAIAWAVLPTLLPISAGGMNPTAVTIAVGAFFFSLAFINSVIFDMRDIEGDAASGVTTIPVLLGVRRTKILLSGMNLIFGILIVVLSAGAIPLPQFCLMVGGVVYAQAYICSFNPSILANVVCDVVADGQFILFGGVLYLVTHLMI